MNKVKIGKRIYKIRYEDGPLLDDKKCRGYCSVDKKLIVILNGMSKKETMETLKHEIMHGFEEEYGIPIPHKMIYALEEPLADLIRNNYQVKKRK